MDVGVAGGEVVVAQRLVIAIRPLLKVADGIGGTQVADLSQALVD